MFPLSTDYAVLSHTTNEHRTNLKNLFEFILGLSVREWNHLMEIPLLVETLLDRQGNGTQ